ncbi:hypothetical protein VTK26DRAFT_1224 [Humicola hyalothermophila]
MALPLLCRCSARWRTKKRAIYPHPDPDPADSPEIRLSKLSHTQQRFSYRAAPRTHSTETRTLSHSRTHLAHTPGSLPSRRLKLPSQYINLTLDIVLDQTPALRSPIAAGVTHKRILRLQLVHVAPSRLGPSRKVPGQSRNSDRKITDLLAYSIRVSFGPFSTSCPLRPLSSTLRHIARDRNQGAKLSSSWTRGTDRRKK